MNYYIQGDIDKAKEISAAFEKLGYDTTRHFFNAYSVLYFTFDGEVKTTTDDFFKTFIKTHPDYKELELPVEPRFKVGDLIACIDDDGDIAIEKIASFSHNKVLLVDTDGCHTEYPKTELNRFHLWSIADIKDGDVLVTTKIRSCPFIYWKPCYDDGCAYYYVGLDGSGNLSIGCFRKTPELYLGLIEDAIPATKEQRDLLFAKIKEAGYQWDVNKKELHKIQPHYDISNFQHFDKVLVRQNDFSTWGVSFFGRYDGMFMCCSNVWFEQCIPFNEKTKHLLGTTDMPREEYINW